MSLSSFPSIPYPSHVCAPNFVTVKLSGKDMYGLWKTQMLCLLESHDMFGFVNGEFMSPEHDHEGSTEKKMKVGDIKTWKRSDALVKGWILGSLSEQTLSYVFNHIQLQNYSTDFTAKDVWDRLQSDYDPLALQQADDKEEEAREINDIKEGNSISEDAESKHELINKDEPRYNERKAAKDMLFKATLRYRWVDVEEILKNKEVTVTDKITINGNSALHVAVSTNRGKEFLKKMMEEIPNKGTLLDLRNADGSTLLHVAAIVGNLDAAKILVEINHDLLFAKDREGYTPLSRALSNMHTDTYLYLLNLSNTHDIEMATLFAGSRGDELLVNAISSKDYDSADALLKNYKTLHSDAVLMALAQNFPCTLNIWESKIFTCIHASRIQYSHESWQETRRYLSQTYYMGAIVLLLAFACKWIHKLYMAILVILLLPFTFVKVKVQKLSSAENLLVSVCELITNSKDSNSLSHYYTNPILEATRQNAYEFVTTIVFILPDAIWSTNEDGHNIIQYAVINRSESVYNLIFQMSEHRNIYRTIKDSSKNNLLHMVARLAPTNKLNLISGAALQIQRELQWFKEVERFVCPLNIIQKNSFEETPQMVFTREHKELVIEGEKWMKTTAESYTITAALITTIVFAAAITVPGGNTQDTGLPLFTNKTAFKIFALSDAISLFTSVTSLLMFLSILTARFSEQDFLFKLPTKLIIGLATLFISTTSMIVAFGATLFLVFGQSNSWILVPIAALTCLPITSFVTLQFPLVFDLITATYGRSIFYKKSYESFY